MCVCPRTLSVTVKTSTVKTSVPKVQFPNIWREKEVKKRFNHIQYKLVTQNCP